MMNAEMQTLAPGARIVVRDAEWIVRRVDRTSRAGYALSVTGLSEIVRDKSSVFLTEAESDIRVLDPAETSIVPDESSTYQASLLYLESLLRQTPPTDEQLYIGHKAAMDPVEYQLDPAAKALQQPRQRILIADSVGLGKTLEAGILLSELIRRGRGKRILVVAVKSMLTQFQKEMWSRFTIPLVRLDSIGLERIRTRIPTNHNPFYYFDRSIISVDTLKQDNEFRIHLENAYWDIIVIDEAHNVAERGQGRSMRAKLAKLLSSRSDTLIMLSATPHDGRARSFASLMNMLDPTAIADPDHYGPEDIRGLFIRRFKKDIQNQVQHAFKERKINVAYADATPAEEAAFGLLEEMEFSAIDRRKGGAVLFKTVLEKALFSSPVACQDTLRQRIRRLSENPEPAAQKDIEQLNALDKALEAVSPAQFSKYQRLLSVIQEEKAGHGWTGQDPTDRLVIFTERIDTLNFLFANLPRDLNLKRNQVALLHGALPDTEQQGIVEDFGRDESPLRLLIASDVASEGINLHFLSHRLIHFDIPWSLMVFQQRNGRIDRYGQKHTPMITYLVTRSKHSRIRGDMRILELLIQKDEEAVKNIGDPSALMGVYDISEEEAYTAKAIEEGLGKSEFEAKLEAQAKATFDPLAVLMGEEEQEAETWQPEVARMPSLFPHDFAYAQAALAHLYQQEKLWADVDPEARTVELPIPKDLQFRFRFLPKEIQPEKDKKRIVLTDRQDVIQNEISRSRKDESAWPKIHYLWPLHPVMEWLNDKVQSSFRRHEAPLLTLPGNLEGDEAIFLMTGVIPNLKGHPLIQRWFGVRTTNGALDGVEPLEVVLERTRLGGQHHPNPEQPKDPSSLEKLLPKVVQASRDWMLKERQAFEDWINPQLDEHLTRLERLRERHSHAIQLRIQGMDISEKRKQAQKEQKIREVDSIFDEYLDWIEGTMTTEKEPYLKLAAVFSGA